MQNLAKWVRRAENLVSFTALAVLTGSVLWGVLTRYVTERPAVWTTELSGILFTWVVFIGAMTAHQEGRHIRVTLLIDLLPAAARRALRKLADGLVLAFLAYAAWLSFVMMQKGATRPSPVLDIPCSCVYLATLLALVGMSLTSALRLLGLMDPPPVDALEDVV